MFVKISLSLYKIALTDIMVMSVRKCVGIVKTFHSAIMSMEFAWTVVKRAIKGTIANKVWNIRLHSESALSILD